MNKVKSIEVTTPPLITYAIALGYPIIMAGLILSSLKGIALFLGIMALVFTYPIVLWIFIVGVGFLLGRAKVQYFE